MYVQISIQATTHDDNHATYLTVGTENATSTERYTCWLLNYTKTNVRATYAIAY